MKVLKPEGDTIVSILIDEESSKDNQPELEKKIEVFPKEDMAINFSSFTEINLTLGTEDRFLQKIYPDPVSPPPRI